MIERTIGVEMIKELGCNLIIYYRGLPDRSICLVLDQENVQKLLVLKIMRMHILYGIILSASI